MKERVISIVLLMIFLGGRPAVAGADLTLEQAVGLALEQNPDILAARKEILASQGRRLQLEAIPEPELVFSDEGIPFSPSRHPDDEKEISFGIQQSIEFPGKVSQRGKIGRFGEDISGQELARLELIMTARVKEAYYKAVLSRRTIQALEETARLLDDFIAAATARYQSGQGLYLDVLRTRVEKMRVQNQLIEARKDLSLDKARLNLLLGRKGDEPVELATDLAYVPLARNLSDIQAEALKTRPSIRVAALRVELAGAGLKLAQMSKLPDFSVGLFTPSLRTGSWGFALGVSVPLYWWKRQKGEVLESEARREIESISEESVRRRVLTRIDSAYAAAKASEEQVRIFEQKLLAEVEDQLKISLTHYQYGKTDTLNLLDIFRTDLATRLEYLKSLYLYLVSLSDLEKAGEEYE